MASQHRIVPLVEPPKALLKPTASLPETPSKAPSIPPRRPDPAPRSSTAPSPTTAFEGYFAPVHAQQRPHTSHNSRNRSPYSRTHLRSRSSGAASAAPPMTRAHSMPNPRIFGAGLDSSSSPVTASSPMRSPARNHSPLRAVYEDHGKQTGKSLRQFYYEGQVPTIEEDSELDIRPRTSHSTPVNSYSATFSRSGSLRRRPASPLHSLAGAQHSQGTIWIPASVIDAGGSFNPSLISSGSNSPSLGPSKYNESYPSLHSYASQSSFGSMPSTPTSARSRSPSISSLGTIEDEPDLESEAVENERIERLRLAAERQERIERGEEDEGGRRRSSFDQPRSFGRNSSRERKRWSVCGGERRADLDLETIWED